MPEVGRTNSVTAIHSVALSSTEIMLYYSNETKFMQSSYLIDFKALQCVYPAHRMAIVVRVIWVHLTINGHLIPFILIIFHQRFWE